MVNLKYRVISEPPEYWIGYGENDIEFTVIAKSLSSYRARQIARLLNQDENTGEKEQGQDNCG
jgi:hypothetical protein